MKRGKGSRGPRLARECEHSDHNGVKKQSDSDLIARSSGCETFSTSAEQKEEEEEEEERQRRDGEIETCMAVQATTNLRAQRERAVFHCSVVRERNISNLIGWHSGWTINLCTSS